MGVDPSLRIGLIARADDRGLGHQTWEMYRHLHPARTLVVRVPASEAAGFAPRLDRFAADDTVTVCDLGADGGLPPAAVAWLVAGCDVIVSAETLYDWSIVETARARGVASVVQLNPELWPHARHEHLPHPSVWWAPTTWRLETLPAGVRHVPVPVPVDRWPNVAASPGVADPSRPLAVLHVAGHAAAGDRNGTKLLAKAVGSTRQPMTVTVVSQDRVCRHQWPRRPHLEVRVVTGSTGDYWDLYAGHDVVVIPRRYGGLCLPALEAQAAGAAVVMPGCSPQVQDWPAVVTVKARQRGRLATQGGMLSLVETDPRALGTLLDRAAKDRALVAGWQAAGRAWAERNSWAERHESYVAELRHAVDVERARAGV